MNNIMLKEVEYFPSSKRWHY